MIYDAIVYIPAGKKRMFICVVADLSITRVLMKKYWNVSIASSYLAILNHKSNMKSHHAYRQTLIFVHCEPTVQMTLYALIFLQITLNASPTRFDRN